MHKVKFYRENRFIWDCPQCEAVVYSDEEPEDILICDNCGEEFEAEEE